MTILKFVKKFFENEETAIIELILLIFSFLAYIITKKYTPFGWYILTPLILITIILTIAFFTFLISKIIKIDKK